MKRIFFFAVLTALSFSVFAQEKSVVGKWKLTKLNSQGVTFNIEDPAQMKSELTKQFEASGQPVDSNMVNMVFNQLYLSLSTLTFDFGSDGKLLIDAKSEDAPKKEEENYTVDYTKGVITSKSKEKEQKIGFKFEGETLILTVEDSPGKSSVLSFKKLK